jgi:hypothetical protein
MVVFKLEAIFPVGAKGFVTTLTNSQEILANLGTRI